MSVFRYHRQRRPDPYKGQTGKLKFAGTDDTCPSTVFLVDRIATG
ncbi:hypothetical protein [Streptomyces californicus]